MEVRRTAFQGIKNIIRFNWHFYVIAAVSILLLIALSQFLSGILVYLIYATIGFTMLGILASLAVSYYIYDYSDLYELRWIDKENPKQILNVNAGFDETSELIKNKKQNTTLSIIDFYNPNKHTEVSIKRARERYPSPKETISVETDNLPFADKSFDLILCVLSAHEIRDQRERTRFFKELSRVLADEGKLMVTEHLRNTNNFLAFQIGFFHFFSKPNWTTVFEEAGLKMREIHKNNPFISTFILTH
ncbi:class I SAM-dependent methyltransferase [Sphingobacterium hotanense]|uniref:class I SAM-dependent methyltransferase n=1 Tax=Sphingobacterium hotanense TaxID=649196 RepID=UPI0021A6C74F|nr:class I SAM-dependent methyltransferase [Sphingobacterium hotanense]MCT1525735.1 class I SAM-dependent methyltransferase [Sphingobacterium hotanense]